MELRSHFSKLRSLLTGAGMYEDGMEMEEMRELAQAMEMSVESYHDEEDVDLHRALKVESEVDFLLTSETNAMLSSTMIGSLAATMEPSSLPQDAINSGSFERDCDSPPTEPIQLIVEAVVHHSCDWSPAGERSSIRKRLANESTHHHISNEVLAKRPLPEQQQNGDPNSLPPSPNGDSGFTGEEMSSLSSISDASSVPSIGEMPSRLLISTSSAVVSEFSRSEIDDID